MHTAPPDQATAPSAPIAVTVAEARRISGLSRSELYRRMACGAIKARKAGRTTLILMDSLRAYLDGLPPASFRAPRTTP